MKQETEYYNLFHPHLKHPHKHKHKEKSLPLNTNVAVTVIGGFLGAGKTSLVNHIVSNSPDKPVDVLVREYGEISIDNMLIHVDPQRLHVFPGISLHFDPQIMLYGLLDHLYEELGNNIHHILLETSGLDEPDYMLRLFFLEKIRTQYYLSSYITIVDAEFAYLNLDEYPIVREQVAFADVILLNKIDLVKPGKKRKIIQRLKNINGMAKIHETQFCKIKLDSIIKVDLFDQLMNMEPIQENNEDKSMDQIKTVALTEKRPMDKNKTNNWLDQLFRNKSIKLLRSKGFFHFANSDYKFEFQGVRTSFHSKADRLWDKGEERKSTVVIIGEGLDAEKLKQDFSECV